MCIRDSYLRRYYKQQEGSPKFMFFCAELKVEVVYLKASATAYYSDKDLYGSTITGPGSAFEKDFTILQFGINFIGIDFVKRKKD